MQKNRIFFQLILYCLCAILVVFFVNLYSVWAIADKMLPNWLLTALPIIAGLIFTSAALFYLYQRKSRPAQINSSLLLLGGAICIAALLIPDSRFPVKRIHVVEYMTLVCLVRYVMSWRIQGAALLFFSVMATILFGIHDELLQGIHPSRTYGLRDMFVNGVAALGGGLVWHGGALFVREMDQQKMNQVGLTSVGLYLCWLSLAILAFVVPLTVYRQEVMPYWPLLPLSAAMVVWALFSTEISGGQKYGCVVVSCLACLFFLYPVAINALAYSFY